MDTLCLKLWEELLTTDGHIMLKLWEGLLTQTTDGRLMFKTMKVAVNINYWWTHYA
jgi:hypothetical protein